MPNAALTLAILAVLILGGGILYTGTLMQPYTSAHGPDAGSGAVAVAVLIFYAMCVFVCSSITATVGLGLGLTSWKTIRGKIAVFMSGTVLVVLAFGVISLNNLQC